MLFEYFYLLNNHKEAKPTMGMRDLNIGDIVRICNLYSNEKYTAIFQQNPILNGIIPFLQETKEAAIDSRDMTSHQDPVDEKVIRGEIGDEDKVHDKKYRALWYLLIACEHYFDGSKALQIKKIRKMLFPYGLSIVTKSWSIEAGEAYRLEKQLEEPGINSLLKSLKINDTTALQFGLEVVESGKKIDELLSMLPEYSSQKTENKISDAKAKFAKLIKAIKSVADIAYPKDLPDSEKNKEILMTPYQDRLDAVSK